MHWLAATLLWAAMAIVATAEAKPFGGEEAAWVDWAFQNCDLTATSKHRGLVDTAASGSSFQKAYEQQYRKIVEQARTTDDTRKLCKSIRTWYGAEGEREPGLVAEKADGSRLAPPVASGGVGATPAQPSPARQGGSLKKGGF